MSLEQIGKQHEKDVCNECKSKILEYMIEAEKKGKWHMMRKAAKIQRDITALRCQQCTKNILRKLNG